MAETRIHQQYREGGIAELVGGLFTMPSFTREGVSYKTDPVSGYCNCGRGTNRGDCEKHPALAEAIAGVRARGAAVRLFSSRAAEEELVEIARLAFAPVKGGESCVDSYRLLLRALSYRHCTERLRRQAAKRHGRVLALNERGRLGVGA